MCGIAGFSLSPTEITFDPARLARELSYGIMSRGRDATGTAWIDQYGIQVRKSAVSALRFHAKPNVFQAYKNGKLVDTESSYIGLGGFVDMPFETKMAIIHTRFATQGDPADSVNNHPLRRGEVVGVHNGCISNDDALFRMLDTARHGEVDSEAIFALLQMEPDIAPWTALDWVSGTMAIAWFDTRDAKPTLHLARGKSSPICLAQTKAGSLIFASEMRYVKDACKAVGLQIDWEMVVEEQSYLRVQEGRLLDYTMFTSRTPIESPTVQGELDDPTSLVDLINEIESNDPDPASVGSHE